MMMHLALRRGRAFAAAAAVLLFASGAQAATFSIVGGNSAVLDTDFNPLNPTWDPAQNSGITIGSNVLRFNSSNMTAGKGLFVAPETPGFAVDLIFIYRGSEASYQNLFEATSSFASGSIMFDNKAASNPDGALSFAGGLVPLMFRSVGAGDKDAINGGPINPAVKMSFALSSDKHFAYAFFEDIAVNGDKDFDDMAIKIAASEHCVVRCEIEPPSETPLPAAVWLLGSVLAGGAGFGRWRRRKAKKAARVPA